MVGGGGGGGGGGTGDTSLESLNFFLEKGPHEAFKMIFIFTFLDYIFTLHCLDSMSERLEGIISMFS